MVEITGKYFHGRDKRYFSWFEQWLARLSTWQSVDVLILISKIFQHKLKNIWHISSCRDRTVSHSRVQDRQHSRRDRRVRRIPAASGGRRAWGTACSWRPPAPCPSWCTPRPGWTGWRRSERGRHRSRQRCRTSRTWTLCCLSDPEMKYFVQSSYNYFLKTYNI